MAWNGDRWYGIEAGIKCSFMLDLPVISVVHN